MTSTRRFRGAVRRAAARARGREAAPGGLLSVVMALHDTEKYVAEALRSVLEQSYGNLEVVVVDDGSTDRSREVVLEVAARDPRVRLVTQDNAGCGAARNHGVRLARGEFLAFCDSDDRVLPGAYQTMVEGLQRSGSDFATGTMVRGEDHDAVRPQWMSRVMDADRSGVTIEDHPDMLLDITAPNKIFRLAYWRALGPGFPEGVRYEDQALVTKAYLQARAFDMHKRKVYHWRSRSDGTSISQQKALLGDLRDRLTSQTASEELLASHSTNVREAYYLKLIDYDLPAYMRAALQADSEYVETLCARLRVIKEQAPPHVWSLVPFGNRALGWLLADGDLESAARVGTWLLRLTDGRPTHLEDGELVHDLPLDDLPELLPREVRAVSDADVRSTARLTAVWWEGGQLVLRGSAFLTFLDAARHPRTLGVDLVEQDGTRHTCDVTLVGDERLDWLSGRAYEDHTASGFEARVDAAALAAALPPGQHALPLELTQSQQDHQRRGVVTHINWWETAGSRAPRVVGDRMVRLAGNLQVGLEVLVHDTWAIAESARAAGSSVELVVRCPVSDPATSFVVRGRGVEQPVPSSDEGSGRTRVVLDPPEVPGHLEVVHASGRRHRVLWAVEDGVVGAGSAFVLRGQGQGIWVGAPRPSVQVRSMQPIDEGLLVTGSSLGAAGRRLCLRGDDLTGLASAPLPEGDFEVVVPVVQDPWGFGPTSLVPGRYELAGADDAAVDCRAGEAFRHALPLSRDVAGQDLRLGVDGNGKVLVWSHPMGERDLSPRRLAQLRTTTYAEARQAPRRPVVLMESFEGAVAGDGPGRIGAELQRRDPELELVWSVSDGSVATPRGTRRVVRESEEWFELLGSAATIVTSHLLPWYFEKAPGQVHVQTWHGSPIKRVGLDVLDTGLLPVDQRETLAAQAAGWDVLLSGSSHDSAVLPRALGYAGPVIEVGHPRNAGLLGPGLAERRADTRRRLGIAEGQRVVLHAPTWRDTARRQKNGRPSRVSALDVDQVVEALPDVHVLVRHHPITSPSLSVPAQRHPSGRVTDVTRFPDLDDLLLACDVLVTDYSSVMLDAALLDRPVALLVPDLEAVRDRQRGLYLDLPTEAPGPLLRDTAALVEHLASGRDEHAERRAQVRERFLALDDAEVVQRAVDAVLEVTSPAATGRSAGRG